MSYLNELRPQIAEIHARCSGEEATLAVLELLRDRSFVKHDQVYGEQTVYDGVGTVGASFVDKTTGRTVEVIGLSFPLPTSHIDDVYDDRFITLAAAQDLRSALGEAVAAALEHLRTGDSGKVGVNTYTLENGLAVVRQADGSVLLTWGENTTLVPAEAWINAVAFVSAAGPERGRKATQQLHLGS